MKKIDLSLYLILNVETCVHDPLWVAKEAVAGGVTAIQLRSTTLLRNEVMDLAKKLKSILNPLAIPFIIDNDVDMAKEIDADGVHLGQKDMSARQARFILGNEKIIGFSISDVEQFQRVPEHGISYLGVGPIFDTTTKKDAHRPMGLSDLSDIVNTSNYPIVAIGGINKQNALDIIRLGVYGIAVAAAICESDNPRESALALSQLFKNKAQ